MDTHTYFRRLIAEQKAGRESGICSICSANRMVLEATMEIGRDAGDMVLIEATANQVNQFGGYTGKTPAEFRQYALDLAEQVGLRREQLILGGDHLGPLAWSGEPAAAAMEKAEVLVENFVRAGFTKIHLDASMRLADDSRTERLSDQTIAARAARLCAAAEASARADNPPVYVIGSEVPIPGGATENENALNVTSPADLQAAVDAFREAFGKEGLDGAWKRVVAVVVQPGVEFADNTILPYRPEAANELVAYAKGLDGMILEGHSTDYQSHRALRAMRRDGIAILKVGPALTFALREALFSLERMERILYPFAPAGGYSRFADVLEQKLMERPACWKRYYHGTAQEIAYARKFSLSDRCRYYLEEPDVLKATARLFQNINNAELPFGLVSQFFPAQKEQILTSEEAVTAERLVREHIKDVIRTYR